MNHLISHQYQILILVLAFTFNNAQAINTDDAVRFSSTGQSLFNGSELEPHLFKTHFINEQIPDTVRGQIRKTPDTLPVSTLQVIWRTAMDTCLGYSYTLRVAGVKLTTITPSTTECINGEIRYKYCTLPLKTGWKNCVNNSLGDYRKTWIKDVGAGIGPLPTEPATRSYDIGMELHYSMDIQAGIEGGYILDPGTVDVNIGGQASIGSDVDFTPVGEIIRIDTAFSSDDTQYKLKSRFPNIDFSFGSFMFGKVDVFTKYANVDYATGEQLRGGETVYTADSRNTSVGNAAIDGIVRFADSEWLGANFSPAGIDIRIKELTLPLFSGSVLEKQFVVPGINPIPGVPSVSFASMALSTAELNTPVGDNYNCGDCVPLREFIDADGIIHNTVPTGTRPVFAGLTDGSRLTWPVITDGMQDNDFFRMDLDLDVMSLIFGVPLGVVWEGPIVKTKLGDLDPVAAVELNAIDIDVSAFFSLDQHLSFDPNMQVTLNFTPQVMVRLDGETEFKPVSSVTFAIGLSVEIIQPQGGVSISPTYKLSENRFMNDTKINISTVLQETMLQMRLYGLIPDVIGGGLGIPTNFAALKISPELAQPQPLFQSNVMPVSLQGFNDIKGKAIFIGATLKDTLDGNADNTSLDDNQQNNNGGSSSGSFNILMLLLFGLLYISRGVINANQHFNNKKAF